MSRLELNTASVDISNPAAVLTVDTIDIGANSTFISAITGYGGGVIKTLNPLLLTSSTYGSVVQLISPTIISNSSVTLASSVTYQTQASASTSVSAPMVNWNGHASSASKSSQLVFGRCTSVAFGDNSYPAHSILLKSLPTDPSPCIFGNSTTTIGMALMTFNSGLTGSVTANELLMIVINKTSTLGGGRMFINNYKDGQYRSPNSVFFNAPTFVAPHSAPLELVNWQVFNNQLLTLNNQLSLVGGEWINVGYENNNGTVTAANGSPLITLTGKAIFRWLGAYGQPSTFVGSFSICQTCEVGIDDTYVVNVIILLSSYPSSALLFPLANQMLLYVSLYCIVCMYVYRVWHVVKVWFVSVHTVAVCPGRVSPTIN
jgi:hypothetical protein